MGKGLVLGRERAVIDLIGLGLDVRRAAWELAGPWLE
jgi:hypothetical protein